MTLLIVVLVVAVLAAVGVTHLLGAGGGPQRGLASGFEVQRSLSPEAMRRRAATTRPNTTITRSTPARDVGIEIGTAGRRTVMASHEETVLVFSLPRSGKTALLGNHVIDAPGACVATSTKADLYVLTAALRTDRPVYVLNPEGLGGIESTLRWSPISGCDNPQEAIERAGYLLAGASSDSGGDRRFWNGNAFRVLRCLLMAAALAGRTMHDLARWAQDFRDATPVNILAADQRCPRGWADELRQIQALPDRTRDSIAVTLAESLAFMADPELARAAVPDPDDIPFDVHRFLRAHGTLYLLGSHREYGPISPLFTAFTGYLFEKAKFLATQQPGGRIDPPLMLVLDEAALICRIPLERWTADAGGRGIPMVVSVQGPDQLYDVWGEKAGRVIWTNCGMKVTFGGMSVGQHLDELSALCGTRFETRRDSAKNARPERIPVLSPHDIRQLPDFTMLVLYRNLPPIIARVRPVWERADVRSAGGAPAPRRQASTGPLAPIIWLAEYRRTRNRRRAS